MPLLITLSAMLLRHAAALIHAAAAMFRHAIRRVATLLAR